MSRASLRLVIRHPAYILVSIATLALAVGANLVVFAYVNALWLRPPPIADPDRVVVLLGRGFVDDLPDPSRYSDAALNLFRQSGAFHGVAGQAVTSGDFVGHSPRITVLGVASQLETLWVTPGYFSVLGVRLTGREFGPRDGIADGASPVVISDRFWRTALGGRPDVIGQRLNGQPVPLDVVGIAPPGFQGARRGERADLWLPHHLLPRVRGEDANNLQFAVLPMIAIARLNPGVSPMQARVLVSQNGRTPPNITTIGDMFGASDLPMVRVQGGGLMTIAAVTAAFVLLGGCATLMALTLVHYERRSHEFAVRAALGATRARLASQLAFELCGLAAAGTGIAVLLSSWAIRLLPQVSLPGGIDVTRLDLSLDWWVVVAAFAGCLVTFAVAGAIPVARFTRSTVALGVISPVSTTARASVQIRQAVLAVHVGATTVVLVAAALFVQSVVHAFGVGPGFDADHTIFATVQTRYRGVTLDEPTFHARAAKDTATGLDIVERIKALPGVDVVALGASPIGPEVEERATRPKTINVDGQELDALFGFLPVGGNYLDAIGTPLTAGRIGVKDEAVITPALADDLWPGESPLGKQLTFGRVPPITVVGVADPAVGSVRLGRPRGLLHFADRTVPDLIRSTGVLELTVRATRAQTTAAEIERLLTAAFPDAPRVTVRTGLRLMEDDLGRERLTASMFSGFGAVALLLAVVSVFGLVAYLVESRWREFAVRMALGATRTDVAGRALWVSLGPTLVGTTLGLIGALAFGRAIESSLFGITGADAFTYVGVGAMISCCAGAAGAFACRRLRTISLADSLKAQ